RPPLGLQSLLQRRFEVRNRKRRPPLQVHSNQLRSHNPTQNKLAGHLQARVQVHRRHNRLQGIHQQRSFGSPPTFFLSTSKTQVLPHIQLLRHVDQVPLTYQVSPYFR